jgi:hypothetical protein
MGMNFDEPAPTLEEVWRLFRETDLQFKETDRRFKETDLQFKETDRKIQELTKKMGEMNNRLGEFVEGIVKPGIVRLFQERGIPIHKVYPNVSAQNKELGLATEIDFLVVNQNCCALIEVKSKLKIDDITYHIERMKKFRILFPEYSDKEAYAAVAAMLIPENVLNYAYQNGFLVIAQKGEDIMFLNHTEFKPKSW